MCKPLGHLFSRHAKRYDLLFACFSQQFHQGGTLYICPHSLQKARGSLLRFRASVRAAHHVKSPSAGAEGLLTMLFIAKNQSRPNLSFKMTSCEPPSTMLVEDTSVIFALSRSSLRLSAPQLHIVERILLSEMWMLSRREPA